MYLIHSLSLFAFRQHVDSLVIARQGLNLTLSKDVNVDISRGVMEALVSV